MRIALAIVLIVVLPFVHAGFVLADGLEIEAGKKGAVEAVKDAHEGKSGWDLVSSRLTYRHSFTLWYPGFDGQLLKYKPRVLQTERLDYSFRYKGHSLFRVGYEAPYNLDTSKQTELLTSQQEQRHGFEQFKMGVEVLRFLTSQLNSDNYLVNLVGSIRATYTKERFFGGLTAGREFLFVRRDAPVTPGPGGTFFIPASHSQNVSANANVSFKTVFDDYEATFSLLPNNDPGYDSSKCNLDCNVDFRVGYYYSEWRRPSTSDLFVRLSDGAPVVFESSFKTQGLVIWIGPIDREKEGIKLDLGVKVGVSNEIDHAIRGLSQTLLPSQSLNYYAVNGGIWHNWVKVIPGKSWCETRLCELRATLGGYGDYRGWSVSDRNTQQSVPVEQDVIWKVLINVGATF